MSLLCPAVLVQKLAKNAEALSQGGLHPELQQHLMVLCHLPACQPQLHSFPSSAVQARPPLPGTPHMLPRLHEHPPVMRTALHRRASHVWCMRNGSSASAPVAVRSSSGACHVHSADNRLHGLCCSTWPGLGSWQRRWQG